MTRNCYAVKVDKDYFHTDKLNFTYLFIIHGYPVVRKDKKVIAATAVILGSGC